MWDRITRAAQPEHEALALAEVKEQLRVDFADDDAFLTRCIRAARQMVEGPDGAGIAIMATGWTLTLDCFPAVIRIPMGPVLAIDAVKYINSDGVQQTLPDADKQWRADGYGALVAPAFGLSWPSTRRGVFDAVAIEFTAGFPGTDADTPDLAMVPESLRAAMLMLIGHWNANRETSVIGEVPSEIAFAFGSILNQFRVGRVA